MEDKIEITRDQAIAAFAFVEGVTYRLAEDYDEESPGYDFCIPMETSNYAIADCWIVDCHGEICPGCAESGVPIAKEDLGGIVG